jgi:hypothetical protein
MSFMVIQLFMVSGFAFSTYYREVLLETDNTDSVLHHLRWTIFTMFGDFGNSDNIDNPTGMFIFYFTCFIMLIVMMNLLIGIISEKLSEVLEQR